MAIVTVCIVIALVVGSATPAAPPEFGPFKVDDGLLLFDATRHDGSAVRNYTASWRNGSDLVPVATAVTKNEKRWIEFRFRGSRGMACSTLYFAEPLAPDKGKRYEGVTLVLDCRTATTTRTSACRSRFRIIRS